MAFLVVRKQHLREVAACRLVLEDSVLVKEDKPIGDRLTYQATALGRVVVDKRQAISSASVVAEVGTCQVIQVDRRLVGTSHKRE